LIYARHAAFEDAEKSFDRIGMRLGPDVFANSLLNGEMLPKFLSYGSVDGASICPQPGIAAI
jgi:hypothetical protein